jgi:hypothetical protein
MSRCRRVSIGPPALPQAPAAQADFEVARSEPFERLEVSLAKDAR